MEIATGGVDGVTRWGLEKDGRELSVLETYAGYSHFQWSHSGRFLVLWNERQFRLLDGRGHRGALMPVFEATSDAAVASVQFSASDSYFLLLSEQTVQVFKTNRMVAVRGTPVLARKVGVKEELVPASFVGDCGLVHVTPSLQLSYTNLPTPPEDPAQEQDSATEEQATEEQATEEHAAKKVATAPELAAKELTSQVLSESGERVSSLAVYSAPNPRIAYFCEGNPSYISVIELKEAADAGAAANAGAAADTDIGTLKMVCGLVSKTPIGRATEVEMSWNRSGCFLLAKQSGAVDVTGKSYYGTSKLHLIQVSVAAGQKEPVELGQVRSVATNVQFWSWNAVQNNSFFVGHGPLPCVMEVWNAVACKPSIKLGEERRNFLRCCHSLPLPPATEPGSKPDRRAKLGLNMAVIGGFGNLPGDVEVWDISKQEIIGLTKLPWTVDLSFSPDAYWLLASTTTPRLRVDNCLKIVRVNGEPVLEKAFDELYQADWRPVPVQHARALSPGRGVYKPKANNTLEGLFKTKKETSSGLFGRVMTGTNEKRSLTATQLGSNATTQTKPARTVPGMVPGMTIPANNNKGIDEVGNDWARMSEMQLAKQAVKLNRQLHRAYDISQKAAIKAQLDAITAECVRRRSQSS